MAKSPIGQPKNRYDVQVVFPDVAFGIKNRPDVTLTPEAVVTALEEFCQRVRGVGKAVEKESLNG